MGGTPKTVITDQQQAIRAALTELKSSNRFNGYHLLDIFHILRNVKKETGRQSLHYFKWLAKCKTEQQYNRTLEKLLH